MFLNQDKEERARKVVADPEKFAAESVERVALGRVDAKASTEEKVLEVYKLLGGLVGEDKVRAPKAEGSDEAGATRRTRRSAE